MSGASRGWDTPLPDPYVELADRAAHDAARRERAALRHRQEQAAATATWLGTLRDLAERAMPVVLTASAGRSHRGQLVGVGADHVVLEVAERSFLLIATDTIRSLRPEPERLAGAATGGRGVASTRTLADVLDRHAEQRAEVAVHLRDTDEVIEGRVLAVGEDLVSLRTTTGRSVVFLPLAGVAALIPEPGILEAGFLEAGVPQPQGPADQLPSG